jgi:hypothetical protein
VKLTRTQVRAKVLASAAQHSALMLEHENACFARIRSRFAAPPAVPYRTVQTFRNNADARSRMVEQFQERVYRCLDDVELLAGLAAVRARTAILRELKFCEQGLPTSARGRAAAAVAAVDLEPIQSGQLWVWKATVVGYHTNFRSALTGLLSTATDIGQVERGLFGSGGAWWASVSSMQQHARGMATAIGNEVRLKAMEGFNG